MSEKRSVGEFTGISGSGLDSSTGSNSNKGTTNIPLKAKEPTYDPQIKTPPQTMPDVKNKFKPQIKEDNMMAENDPVKRQPERWQAEAKKDQI